MNPGNRVEVIDKEGWRKDFPLEKALVQLGSDPRNDVVLDARRGAGVAPRHLQLIALSGNQSGYRVINLSETDVTLGSSGERTLAPRSVVEITDGERFQLGEFILVFRLGEPAAEALPTVTRQQAPRPALSTEPVVRDKRVEPRQAGPVTQQASASIGLRLSLPRFAVDADSPIEGIVTVQNLGSEPGVQFRLRLEGLEPDYYEMGPGPILFPNVEKGVYLSIRHPRGPAILAGRREIAIHATAPEAYPGESVTVSQAIEFLPYYDHVLRLVPVK